MQHIKKSLSRVILGFILVFLYSCAKPTVVSVTLPEDKNLTCVQLEKSLDDSRKFREKALGVTGNTGKNQARAMLFWPALMMTYVNAHEAIVAAQERSVHLINLMQEKKCENTNKLLNDIETTMRVQTLKDLTEAYKSLNELYKSGGLTEKEYTIQKKKILGQ